MGFVDVKDEMLFGKSLPDVKDAVKATLQKFGWKIKKESGNTIECGTGVSIQSLGSNVTITLSNAGGKTKVEMHSKDKLGVAGMFGGNMQSKRNIKKMLDELSKRVANL